MKIKVKKKVIKTYKIELTKQEMDGVQLAVCLMLQNEHTHPNWVERLEPVADGLLRALNMDPNPYL